MTEPTVTCPNCNTNFPLKRELELTIEKKRVQTKTELVYSYLTGPRFRQRIEAIVDRFSEMQEDLDKERRSMTRIWAKREAQIRSVIESTAGMYGDLQEIAGKALLEIDGIALPMIHNQTPPESGGSLS